MYKIICLDASIFIKMISDEETAGPLNYEIVSPAPKIQLLRYFDKPFDFSISAARTCYSPRVINTEEVTADQKQRIGGGCFEGGHHTVFQHATFSFGLENVSRHFVWSFLHSHPFYNSEQSSQRYVRLNEIKATIPQIEGKENQNLYKKAVTRAWETYNQLTDLLLEDVVKIHEEIFNKKVADEKERKKLSKKAIEIARYVTPIAAHTSMVHTISGLTLYRLHKVINTMPTQWEQRIVIGEMVNAVKKADPDFFMFVQDPVPLEETPEYKFFQEQTQKTQPNSENFISEFDSQLGNYRSKLVSYLEEGPALMADAVRATMGLTKNQMSDNEAIDSVLNPSKNVYLTEALNVSTLSPLMRAMNHPYFVFKKKLSHTCDSQNQRHRMTSASRPVMVFVDTKKPDYITPYQITRNSEAQKVYDEFMKENWEYKNGLLENGVPIEHAQYVLPNALTLRLVESSNYLNLYHKWRLRSCLDAQREIWELTIEEMEQVGKIFPQLLKYSGPDCMVRFKAEVRPFCTQGNLWCGQPVWAWKKLETEKRAN